MRAAGAPPPPCFGDVVEAQRWAQQLLRRTEAEAHRRGCRGSRAWEDAWRDSLWTLAVQKRCVEVEARKCRCAAGPGQQQGSGVAAAEQVQVPQQQSQAELKAGTQLQGKPAPLLDVERGPAADAIRQSLTLLQRRCLEPVHQRLDGIEERLGRLLTSLHGVRTAKERGSPRSPAAPSVGAHDAQDAGSPPAELRGMVERDFSHVRHVSTVLTQADLSEDLGNANEDEEWRRVLRGVSKMVGGRDQVCVARESLAQHLDQMVNQRYKCLQAPCIVLYYLFFALMLLSHEMISDMSQMEREFRGMLSGTTFEGLTVVKVSGHKNLGNIDTVTDIYTYLQDAVMPLFIPPANSTSPQDLHRGLRYNQVVGGLLLQQTRRPKRPCSSEYPSLGPFDEDDVNPLLVNVSCYPPEDRTDECFGPGEAMEGFCPEGLEGRGRRLRPKKASPGPKLASGAWQLVDHPVYGERFSMVFHEHDGLEVGLRRLEDARRHGWIDEQSSWVGIRLFAMNPDLAVYISLVVNVFFVKSGELIPLIQAYSCMAEPYLYRSVLILDVLWVLSWLHLLIDCMWSLFWGCHSGARREYFLNFWNWVNWSTMAMGLVIILQGLTYIEKLDLVKDAAMTVAFNRPAPSDVSAGVLLPYKTAVQHLHAELVDFNSFMDTFRRYVGMYCVVLMMRLFGAFEVQPRLAIVLQTVVSCLPDILHFLIVLFTMHTGFVVSGMFLFGHRILHFSRFDLAFENCMLMLFGSFDYNELASEHPGTAFFWFFLFSMIMYLIVLNMALAIFMDVYAGMKSKADLSETVLQQLSGMIARLPKRRQQVPTSAVLESVERLDIEMVNKSILMEVCPGLEEQQANDLLKKVEAAEAFEEETQSISDAFKLVGSIRNSMGDVQLEVDALLELYKEGSKPKRLPGIGGAEDVRLNSDADEVLTALEGRSSSLEDFMNEVMSYLVLRGKDARDRLEAMEEHLRQHPPAVTAPPPAAGRPQRRR